MGPSFPGWSELPSPDRLLHQSPNQPVRSGEVWEARPIWLLSGWLPDRCSTLMGGMEWHGIGDLWPTPTSEPPTCPAMAPGPAGSPWLLGRWWTAGGWLGFPSSSSQLVPWSTWWSPGGAGLGVGDVGGARAGQWEGCRPLSTCPPGPLAHSLFTGHLPGAPEPGPCCSHDPLVGEQSYLALSPWGKGFCLVCSLMNSQGL